MKMFCSIVRALMLASASYGFHCPADMKKIDEAMAKTEALGAAATTSRSSAPMAKRCTRPASTRNRRHARESDEDTGYLIPVRKQENAAACRGVLFVFRQSAGERRRALEALGGVDQRAENPVPSRMPGVGHDPELGWRQARCSSYADTSGQPCHSVPVHHSRTSRSRCAFSSRAFSPEKCRS